MTLAADQGRYTLEEYLALEQEAPFKSEFVDGQLFAMAGATDNHNIINTNIITVLRTAARGSKCRVMASDMKVLIQERPQIGYYPDIVVTCDETDREKLFRTRPCLVVEVLSDSTKRIDRNEKKLHYQRISSIKMYLIVDQNLKRVEVCRRSEDGTWQAETLENEGLIELECPNTTLTLEQIYEDVDFSARE
jgi:Uma2 family endonuclease